MSKNIKKFLLLFALVLLLPFALVLNGCGDEPNNNTPSTDGNVTVTYNLESNDNYYHIESNSGTDFRISVVNGNSLSVDNVLFSVYANGQKVTAGNYQVSSNLPTTPLVFGSSYQITYTYGEENVTVNVQVKAFEIDATAFYGLQYSYSEIEDGTSQYIDVIQKIDARMQEMGLNYTLSGLKQQGVVSYEEHTMQQANSSTEVTRTYHSNLPNGSEFQQYEFSVSASNGYVFKLTDGTATSYHNIYWQVLPVTIPNPIITDTGSLVFNPNALQSPTLVFGDSITDPLNTKYNSMVVMEKQFQAGSYNQIEYTLKNEYSRNYKLLNANNELVDNVVVDQTWTIYPLSIPKALIANHEASYYAYDGSEKQPGWALPTGYEYLFSSLSYANNVDVGIATMYVNLSREHTFVVGGQNYTLSGSDLFGCFTWQDSYGLPIDDYSVEFEITQAAYVFPSTVTNKTLEMSYDEYFSADYLLSTLNISAYDLMNSATYTEWSQAGLLDWGYSFTISEKTTAEDINEMLATVGSHTLVLLYTPNANYYSNTVEVEFTFILTKHQEEVYYLQWENQDISYSYEYDGGEKYAPTCSLNNNYLENYVTYLAVKQGNDWVADRNSVVETPTNAGMYITVVNLESQYIEYIVKDNDNITVLTETVSPVWEIRKQLVMLPGDPYYGTTLEYYPGNNYELYFGSYYTGEDIVTDYNSDTKSYIAEMDYLVRDTHENGYAISYEKWNGAEWVATTTTSAVGKYRVCFVFDFDANHIFGDYDYEKGITIETDRQCYEYEVYAITYNASVFALNSQTEYAYTGSVENSSPRVTNLPQGLIAEYKYYNNNDVEIGYYDAAKIGSYKVAVTIKATDYLQNYESVKFVLNQVESTTAEIQKTAYTIIKKTINKNEISAGDLSEDLAHYDNVNSYFNIPEDATYSKYIFNVTVVIEDDNHNQVATHQYYEPLTHYTATITLKLGDYYKDCYTLIGANENDEFVYTFDWTTGKFYVGVQTDVNFGFDYEATASVLPTLDDVVYLQGLPASVTASNWKDIFDLTIICRVWDSSEEYEQGYGTTSEVEAGSAVEVGKNYICEVHFSIKEEYQDRYEMIEYMTYIQIDWKAISA